MPCGQNTEPPKSSESPEAFHKYPSLGVLELFPRSRLNNLDWRTVNVRFNNNKSPAATEEVNDFHASDAVVKS